MILRRFHLFIVAVGVLVGLLQSGSTQDFIPTEDPELMIEPLHSGLGFITNLTFSPDGRLFFIEKNTGSVRIYDASADTVSDQVIRIQPLSPGIEAAAVGLAFDPIFDSTSGGRVYVSHVISDATWRVSSFYEDGKGQGSDLRKVMDFPDCLPGDGFFDKRVHNIENMHFGPNPRGSTPEQVLFISMGDGGILPAGETREENPAMNRENWCGGIYFLDPAHPPDIGDASKHLFCMGVRNAFDFDFHPLSGALYFSENSFDSYDEINQALFGDHFGWDDSVGPNANPAYTDPIYYQARPSIGPTGILVYRGNRLPPRFHHQIFFGTFNLGEIYQLTLEDPADPRSPVRSVRKILDSDEGSKRVLGANEGIIDLTEGPDGWIYFSTGGDPFGSSSLYRIRDVDPPKKFAGIRVF